MKRIVLLSVFSASLGLPALAFAEPGPTADQQSNSRDDLHLTAQIRRSIMADKSLSVNAHNVKIIVANGSVTLKGPVRSESEKKVIENKAVAAAGRDKVKNEIEVKP